VVKKQQIKGNVYTEKLVVDCPVGTCAFVFDVHDKGIPLVGGLKCSQKLGIVFHKITLLYTKDITRQATKQGGYNAKAKGV